MKKVLLVIFVSVLVFSCGKSSKNAGGKTVRTEDGKILVTIWDAIGFSAWKDMINKFNQSQDEIVVQSVFKGSYKETMQAGIAAIRSGSQPNILHVYEVGTGTMFFAKNVVEPVEDFMNKYSDQPFHSSNYIDTIVDYYSDKDRLLSVPFNSSTPVIYYNRDIFEKVGLSVQDVPKTWEDFERIAPKLLVAGYVPLTTSWTSWVVLEAFSARHNIPFASYNNGLEDPLKARIQITELHKKFFQKIKAWYDKGWYVFYDREYAKSQNAFSSGKVAMGLFSSSALSSMGQGVNFKFSVSEMPYLASAVSKPYDTLIGGASFWVLKGFSEEQNKAVAKFVNFLMSTENQKFLHTNTGYLPVSKQAYQELKSEGYYKSSPCMEIPVKQVATLSGEYTKGLRLGNFVQIREIFAEEFEQYLQGVSSLDQFVSNYQERANIQLKEFQDLY
ncbi:MAG: extracellular solute-binding protein [Brevinemataceae bacterium]